MGAVFRCSSVLTRGVEEIVVEMVVEETAAEVASCIEARFLSKLLESRVSLHMAAGSPIVVLGRAMWCPGLRLTTLAAS